MADGRLPIEARRDELMAALALGPVVLTSPTGSGKSTQVPRWCPGRVAVIEPRRVACKTLAARVAELEGSKVGGQVGYHVRDDACLGADTRITFMTPGIALRRFEQVLAHDWVIVDELHERAMDVDLMLALLARHHRGRLVVMSATLDADRVAKYLGGSHVHADVRQFPVTIEYLGGPLLPDVDGLTNRVAAALELGADTEGDVLVFLPGKGEIAAVAAKLSGRRELEVVPLHGGLSLAEQSRAFGTTARRKVVLATNVAETSVTVPGVGMVIDSGLVRRTKYHGGRGFLTLMPIAMDSASQRSGRAGRTMAGRCVRLWQRAASLEARTPPEIRRESLLPLVLAAAACGESVQDLSFLDEPTDYAVEAALDEARALDAVDESGAITACGSQLFGLPLDAPLGRLLVEAKARGCLDDAIDLVAALAIGRPLFARGLGPPSEDAQDLRRSCCDATAMILAVRRGSAGRDPLIAGSLSDARRGAKRLRRAFGVGRPDPERAIDREGLCRTALRADPRCAHVPRQRRRQVAWSNGGTEIELGRESAAQHRQDLEALVVFETRALGTSGKRQARGTAIVATCAAPVPLKWLAAEGLGRERVAEVTRKEGELVATVQRVFARKVIAEHRFTPTGALAREALAKMIARGSLLSKAREPTGQRLASRNLAARLVARGVDLGDEAEGLSEQSPEQWLVARLAELGVEHADDIELLNPADVTPSELPWSVQQALDALFPAEVSTADARYRVTVDLAEDEVILRYLGGSRGRVPRRSTLPAFMGFKVKIDTGKGWALVK
jgi:ATP-dependent RNA helicase HrpB